MTVGSIWHRRWLSSLTDCSV